MYGEITNLEVLSDPFRYEQYVKVTFENPIAAQMCYQSAHKDGLIFNSSYLEVEFASS